MLQCCSVGDASSALPSKPACACDGMPFRFCVHARTYAIRAYVRTSVRSRGLRVRTYVRSRTYVRGWEVSIPRTHVRTYVCGRSIVLTYVAVRPKQHDKEKMRRSWGDRWGDSWRDGCGDGWSDGWGHGWVDGWDDRWGDGWGDRLRWGGTDAIHGAEFQRRSRAEAAYQRKRHNISVIHDTIEQCSQPPMLKAIDSAKPARVCKLPGHLHREIEVDHSGGTCRIEVEIRNQDCVSVAAEYSLEVGASVWILNMASASTPGGGVRKGCNAQEEHLCRCSTLLPHLDRARAEGKYPLHKWPGGYDSIPDVSILVHDNIEFFKCPNDYVTLPRERRFQVGVLTAAAEKVQGRRKLGPNADRFISFLLDSALMQGCTHLVLSAWGCGAFGQCPHAVAKCFQQNFAKVTHAKLKVIFAILDDHNSTDNLAAFQQVFQ